MVRFLLNPFYGTGLTSHFASFLNRSVIDEKIASVCPYCGAGCKLNLVVENNRILRAEAAEGVTNRVDLVPEKILRLGLPQRHPSAHSPPDPTDDPLS